MRTKKLTKLIESLDCGEGQKDVTFADVIDAFGSRGFGPLLIAPALITILPTGAIPGVPIVSAAVICLIAGQIAFGRNNPWVPKKLGDFSIKRKKLVQAIDTVKPYAKALDEVIYPRFEFLTEEVAQRIIAVVCVALSLTMAVLGFVPFVPVLASLPILLFAVGLSLKDGLLTMAGFLFSLVLIGALPALYTLIK